MIKKESVIMQSLPNNGSTWIAGLLANHLPGCIYYDMEFFNPIRNVKHQNVLKREFGCELISCFTNIAKGDSKHVRDDIDKTWMQEPYTFTKEVFSPFKTKAFNDYGKTFVFLRSAENSFPPRRLRVWSFYEHAWYALQQAGYELKAHTLEHKVREAHWVMSDHMITEARELGIEVVWWEDMFRDSDAIHKIMYRATGYEMPYLADEIVASRKNINRAFSDI